MDGEWFQRGCAGDTEWDGLEYHDGCFLNRCNCGNHFFVR
jgi:hypothetical protein